MASEILTAAVPTRQPLCCSSCRVSSCESSVRIHNRWVPVRSGTWFSKFGAAYCCRYFAIGTTKEVALDIADFRLRCGNGNPKRGGFKTMAVDDDSSEAKSADIVEKKREYYLPSSLDESIDQARTATRQAIRDGIKRIQLEILLPLIGATDLDDWPGGIQQQYKAASPAITSLLKGLVDGDSYKEDGGYRKYIIDDSDAVGAWESEKIALVLFPTAETLSEVEALAKNDDRPLLIVNTQWQSGQVISDFGFGSQRRAREAFVNSFEVVYLLKSMRILGEDVRLLKRYPGDWQVFVLDAAGGSNECVAVVPQRPSYKELEAILKGRKGSKADQGWFARLFSELEFNQKSLNEERNS